MQIPPILPQIVALDVVFALAACLQTIHVPLIASRRSSYNRKVICAYEASLVLHLMISALILFASSGSYLVAPLDVCARAMGGVLWLNAAIFAYGVVLMVHYRRPVMLAELLLVVAVTPPVVFAMGSAWAVVLIAEGAFFLFRSIAALLMDVRNRQEDITAFSTIETINVIPVGILYLDPRGHPLLMNRCMRKNLVELHMPTDLGDMSGTWNDLRKLSMQMPESSQSRVRINLDRFGEARVVVEVSPAEIRLFVCDDVMVSGRSFERIIGLDVTEYAHAHDRLTQANHLLALAGKELQAQIEEVKKVADNAAYLRMRARVHDVIGQRLSILHRYLEEGRLDDESLEQIDPLLRSIAADLRRGGAGEPSEQLGDIVHAFGLVSVQIDVEGALPQDARVAAAFLQIIREASTNATKHAQAHQVHVRLWQEGTDAGAVAHMTISNDGSPAPVSYREGTGIPGMRRVAQDLGGSLEVRPALYACGIHSAALQRHGPKEKLMIRVLIVEDQAILRESLARSVGDQSDMTVVAAIADASEALDAVLKERPDMILMDVCTEHDSNGIVAAARIKEELPECRVIIMTGMPEITFVDQAREAGVDSFVYKNVGIDELFGVMRSTLAGYCTFPKPPESIFSGTAALDDVELSILRLACEGKSRREIAGELFMSEGTVKRRISEILSKTGYDNIMRLAVHAVTEGSIVPNMERP